MMNDIINILSSKMRQGDLVAFLGAGVSRSYHDSYMAKTYIGVPTAIEIVEELSKRKLYINSGMSFEEACFLIKNTEGRVELERELSSFIDIPVLKPLPAHKLLSYMSFSAYITTNFDTLLEKALDENRKPYAVVVEDTDVSRWDNNQIPVIKLHGCIRKPKTVIAADDEYSLFERDKPIVTALLKTLLANKVILFLGFGLNDIDFKMLYQELQNLLGDYMPKSYAVVHKADNYYKQFWKAQGIQIVECDATEYLRMLFKSSIEDEKPVVWHPKEDWMKNTYFESLLSIRTSPSETQAIDAFLQHLLQELQSPTLSCEDVFVSACNAVEMIISNKPNFHALQDLWNTLSPKLEILAPNDQAIAIEIVEDTIDLRRAGSRKMNRRWQEVVKKGDNIVLFSQSIRMMELLKTVPSNIQDTCNLYICECRPKSPTPFQDAIAICEFLKDTNYSMVLIPDLAVGNLFARNQINSVIMGAHSIYMKNGEAESFVNTCGTNLIVSTANNYKVPVYLVAESSKFVNLATNESEDVSYEEEENIFGNINILAQLRAEGITRISEMNIGYDLCPFCDNIKLISE